MGTPGSAGHDLRSAYNYTVNPLGNAMVKTDLQIYLPRGCYGRIASRSGLALTRRVSVEGGVIDRDFAGNVSVIIFNHDPANQFKIKAGDKIAQLICEKTCIPFCKESKKITLHKSIRGSGSFGSTDI